LIPSSGDATELPYFSFVEQIRPGAGVVLDRMVVGCEPSGITVPAITLEKLLPSASLTLTINGVGCSRHRPRALR
jgi:hypothetical protein